MDLRHWPLYGLRLRTPRLELRLPGPELLDELASVAAHGVHDPDRMPFSVAWTDGKPDEVARAVFQHALGTVALRSLGVSRRLGYADDGLDTDVVRGAPVTLRRLRLDRAGWEAHRSVDVSVAGLDACRAQFGV
ncbi:hypothetical protein [Streptomyces sp. ms115]|uniref:hypothetical protein n=1 Tax=Streptomyces sp. ms115 TaxID=1827928 RepID=UPI000BF0827C|nr:hypothetical protein [Streptomyces sp. ms115]